MYEREAYIAGNERIFVSWSLSSHRSMHSVEACKKVARRVGTWNTLEVDIFVCYCSVGESCNSASKMSPNAK